MRPSNPAKYALLLLASVLILILYMNTQRPLRDMAVQDSVKGQANDGSAVGKADNDQQKDSKRDKTEKLVNVPSAHKQRSAQVQKQHTTTANGQKLQVTDTKKPATVDKQCTRKESVAYIKTYKTGSSTFYSIFNRVAQRRNQTVLFCIHPCGPGVPILYNSCPHPVVGAFTRWTRNDAKYNSLNDHVIYQPRMIEKYMPRDTVAISSLRHPYGQLMSSLKWGGYVHATTQADVEPVSYYFDNLTRSEQNYWGTPKMSKYFMPSIGNDQLTQKFNDSLAALAKNIPFMMITEKFDESLVLAKRLLCWNTSDIVYIKLKPSPNKKKVNLNIPKYKEVYRKLNPVDHALYDHYLAVYNKMVKEQDASFWKEVETLKDINKRIVNFCEPFHERMRVNQKSGADLLGLTDLLVIPKGPWNDAITFGVKDCITLALNPGTFLNIMLAKQYPQICKTRNRAFDNHHVRYFSISGNNVKINKAFCESPGKLSRGIVVEPLSFDWESVAQLRWGSDVRNLEKKLKLKKKG